MAGCLFSLRLVSGIFDVRGSVSHRVTLGDMASQRSVRFPDELVVAVELEARRRDRSFSYVVVEAVRAAMESPPPPASSPRASSVQRGSVSPSLGRFGGPQS